MLGGRPFVQSQVQLHPKLTKTHSLGMSLQTSNKILEKKPHTHKQPSMRTTQTHTPNKEQTKKQMNKQKNNQTKQTNKRTDRTKLNTRKHTTTLHTLTSTDSRTQGHTSTRNSRAHTHTSVSARGCRDAKEKNNNMTVERSKGKAGKESNEQRADSCAQHCRPQYHKKKASNKNSSQESQNHP